MAKYFFFRTGGSLFGPPVSDWWEELKRAEYHTAIRPQIIALEGIRALVHQFSTVRKPRGCKAQPC